MTYHEKRSISSLITGILIFVIYFLVVRNMHLNGRFEGAEVLQFWGRTILIMIPVTIAGRIIGMILFEIGNKIGGGEDGPEFSDERDKLIELKSTKISMYIFALGFVLAMAVIALGGSVNWMFITLILAGFLSDIVGELFNYIFYRRGF